MGKRALVSISGKPMIATHWDTNSTSLGFHSDNPKIPRSPMMPKAQKKGDAL